MSQVGGAGQSLGWWPDYRGQVNVLSSPTQTLSSTFLVVYLLLSGPRNSNVYNSTPFLIMKLVINVCYGETERDLELAGNNAMLRTKIMVDRRCATF